MVSKQFKERNKIAIITVNVNNLIVSSLHFPWHAWPFLSLLPSLPVFASRRRARIPPTHSVSVADFSRSKRRSSCRPNGPPTPREQEDRSLLEASAQHPRIREWPARAMRQPSVCHCVCYETLNREERDGSQLRSEAQVGIRMGNGAFGQISM